MRVSGWYAAGERSQRIRLGKKLAALRVGSEHSFPAGDVETMLAEIERGYEGEDE